LKCRCKKEQHEILESDGYDSFAPFHILGGGIKSKPAFIQISKFAEKPIKVDFVPNAKPDVLSNYIDAMGLENIPIEGTEAAKKRKINLQYQMPSHDFNPDMCDHLTSDEAHQLNQYVEKIKKHCLGQAAVFRTPIPYSNSILEPSRIVTDPILKVVMNSEPIANIFSAGSEKTSWAPVAAAAKTKLVPDFMDSPLLSDKNKYKLKLMQINSDAMKSALKNREKYLDMIQKLQNKNIPYENDPILIPIEKFLKEYDSSPALKNDVDKYLDQNEVKKPCLDTAIFNSPIFTKRAQAARSVLQDTPVRRLKFNTEKDNENSILSLFDNQGNPVLPTIMKDELLKNVIYSDVVQGLLNNPAQIIPGTVLKVCENPIVPDFRQSNQMLAPQHKLSEPTVARLEAMKINTLCAESGIVNGIAYDKIFSDLKAKKVRFANDCFLQPMLEFRNEVNGNENFKSEVGDFINGLKQSYGDKQALENPIFHPKSDKIAQNQMPIIHEGTSTSGINAFNNNDGITPLSGELTNDMSRLGLKSESSTDLKCHDCTRDILAGDVAVKTEGSKNPLNFHPKCFKCFTCKELLIDLIYFHHNNNVYCARDLAIKLGIPRCQGCDELIFTKEYTVAEGCNFHLKHFCCYYCDIPLGGERYVHDDKTNLPLCIKCYMQNFAAYCNRCKNSISPEEEGVNFNSIHWHTNCFTCSGKDCEKSLIGQRFCVKTDENLPFCSAKCVNSIAI
jgi:hypothetical protein